MSIEAFRAALQSACESAGSQAAWAASKGLSPSQVSDTLQGRREPGTMLLAALGWRRVVGYERVDVTQ